MLRSRSAFRSYLRALRSQYGVALCPSMASTTKTLNIPITTVIDKPAKKIKSSCTYIASKITVVSYQFGDFRRCEFLVGLIPC